MKTTAADLLAYAESRRTSIEKVVRSFRALGNDAIWVAESIAFLGRALPTARQVRLERRAHRRHLARLVREMRRA